jgi:hypothetical protein
LSPLVQLLPSAELGPLLGFVCRRHTGLDHLQAHIPSQQPPPRIHRCHNSIVLVPFVDVCSNVAFEEVATQPRKGFGGEWLSWSSEVGAFWSVDTGNANWDLLSNLVSRYKAKAFGNHKHTVRSFNSLRTSGTLLNQPQPKARPPGV